jgi:hypothetical protein
MNTSDSVPLRFYRDHREQAGGTKMVNIGDEGVLVKVRAASVNRARVRP